eukprot:CAMPEP_0197855132 /NCGR_PEP_ID=MMETSP1438-20131217/26037_1 /TAXON_ID=1461541 /ORGANISM="Pterosperma sp., Strain CCMP1384" /LENGTH=388 /DNA_ID=CAMNT_0043470123 /DNA_START=254 /DNA_END=1420 /DNA_ORIENTATION=+
MDVMSSFEVQLLFKGQTERLSIDSTTSGEQLHGQAQEALGLGADTVLKMICKGKVLPQGADPVFPAGHSGKKAVKIMVTATSSENIAAVQTAKTDDPTIRGFDQETTANRTEEDRSFWGMGQHRQYKFVRFEACTRQSFGHRAGSATPHDFEASRLLKKLATDPGVVAVMVERELVCTTLGEMDPIDDRLMQKKKEEGGCLLGYNTNRGLRIDIKLRPDTLEGFYPYNFLVSTLIHELSHNWVGEHNALFWTNYAQMRVEYFHRHAAMAAVGYRVQGQTTAQLAGVEKACAGGMQSICEAVRYDCAKEMRPHGIPVNVVLPHIMAKAQELPSIDVAAETLRSELGLTGQKLGGENDLGGGSARELALAAAERRAQRHKSEKDDSRPAQ